MNEPVICLVEDDDFLGESLCQRFRIEGLKFDWHKEGRSAVAAIERNRYGTVLCDLRLPDLAGSEIFRAISSSRRPPFIFMTGFGTIDEAVSLLKGGAADFVTKPFDLDQLVARIRGLCGSAPGEEAELGLSPAMKKLEMMVDRVSRGVESVLITGESGVGKEVLARLIHDRSGTRRQGDWVGVNCGAIPEGLIEAELFGYVRGAFTGASRSHKGVIEQANGGTLFLDEIGDMPLPLQARLLRVLQDRKVSRIGSEGATPVDFRLVCATHRDLSALVRDGRFREDLFYRINVINLHIPPLRDRREDILWLAQKILGHVDASRTLSLDAQQGLYAHDWPGNVRQLEHVIRRAAALADGAVLTAADLFPELAVESAGNTASPTTLRLAEALDLAERGHLLTALRRNGGAIGETASELGISRKTLWEKMRRHRIDRETTSRLPGI